MMGGYGQGAGYGNWNMMGGGWFGQLLFFFFAALVIAGIVVLVMWIVRSAGHGSAAATPGSAAVHDEAVAIAKRRYASGEITKEQFDELMRSLTG